MHVETRLLRWGNSFGLRLRKADVERLGLQVGALVAADVHAAAAGGVEDLPVWNLGGVADLDAAAGAGFATELL